MIIDLSWCHTMADSSEQYDIGRFRFILLRRGRNPDFVNTLGERISKIQKLLKPNLPVLTSNHLSTRSFIPLQFWDPHRPTQVIFFWDYANLTCIDVNKIVIVISQISFKTKRKKTTFTTGQNSWAVGGGRTIHSFD